MVASRYMASLLSFNFHPILSAGKDLTTVTGSEYKLKMAVRLNTELEFSDNVHNSHLSNKNARNIIEVFFVFGCPIKLFIFLRFSVQYKIATHTA